MYAINYNPITGCVENIILNDNTFIPVGDNYEFNRFLEFNAKQAEPLDWQTPILVEVPLPMPSTEERLSAIEDAFLAQLLGG